MGPLSGELFFNNRQVSLLDNSSVGRAPDLHCTLRSKNNWEMKVFHLPCKRLDIRVARMTAKNGGPVSNRRQTVSSISTFVLITLTLKNVLFTTYIRKQAHTSRFLSLSATAFAIRSSSSSTSCCLWLASVFLIRSVCSWKALKKRERQYFENSVADATTFNGRSTWIKLLREIKANLL